MSTRSDAVKLWRTKSKQRMIDAMGGSCQICGYDRCNDAMVFHHLDPSIKEHGFGGLRANPKSWITVVVELRKCVLLCNRCHTEVHDGMTSIPEHIAVFDESYVNYKEKIYDPMDICPVCGVDKPVRNRTCSSKCAANFNRKVDWDSVDLLELKKTMSNVAIGKLLGVSDAAVFKRLKKLK